MRLLGKSFILHPKKSEITSFRLPSPVSHLPLPVFGLPSSAFGLPSPVSRLPSSVSRLRSSVFRLPSPVFHLPSPVSRLRSSVFGLPSSHISYPTIFPLFIISSSSKYTSGAVTNPSIWLFTAIRPPMVMLFPKAI